jgi:predicted nucleic acid-binding protein
MGSNGGYIPNTIMTGSQSAHRRRNSRNSLPNIDMLLSLPETDEVTNFQMPVRRMSDNAVPAFSARRNSLNRSLSLNKPNNHHNITRMKRTMSVDDCKGIAVKADDCTDVAVNIGHRNSKTMSTDDCTDVAVNMEHRNRKILSTDDCTDVAVNMNMESRPIEHRRSNSLKASEDLEQSLQTFDSQYRVLSPPPFPRSINMTTREPSSNAVGKSARNLYHIVPKLIKPA